MELGNWQRDVVKIVLYVAGVLMAVMPVIELVTFMLAATDLFEYSYGVRLSSDQMAGLPYAALQSTVRAIVGILLAAMSTKLSHWAFPDRPVARTPSE